MHRLPVTSSRPFEDVVAAFEAAIGPPNPRVLRNALDVVTTFAEMQAAIRSALGPSGLVEFARYELGAFSRKESGLRTPKMLRFVIGNPLLSYDTITGFLAPCENATAVKVACALDSKVERLLRQAA